MEYCICGEVLKNRLRFNVVVCWFMQVILPFDFFITGKQRLALVGVCFQNLSRRHSHQRMRLRLNIKQWKRTKIDWRRRMSKFSFEFKALITEKAK